MTSGASTPMRGGWNRWLNRRAPSLWGRLRKKLSLFGATLGYRIFGFLISHPLVFKIWFALQRRYRPIAAVRSVVLVAKARDVADVLARIDDFTVTEFLGPKMPWGQFLLNLDGREQHARERRTLDGVGSGSRDGDRLQALVRDAITLPKTASGRHELNVVTDVCEPVVLSIAGNYFGVPMIHGSAKMMRMMSDLGSIVMLEPPEGTPRWNEIRDHIDEFTKRLDEEVRARVSAVSAGAAAGSDLLGRLAAEVAAGTIDHSFVRRYVTGVTTAGTATVVRAATHVIDQLLARPAALKGAQQLAVELTRAIAAAGSAQSAAHQDAKNKIAALRAELLQVAYEALRFRPMLPLLVRYCPRDTLLGKGTEHARIVRAGARAIAAPIAAMFDPEAFPQPWRFRTGRPLENYVHFGVGPRTCFGKYAVDIALIEIVRQVLLLKGLKRAPGSRGRISYEGPVPRSLVVVYEHS